MQLASEVSISGVFALNEEIKLEQVLSITGESPAIVYVLGDEATLTSGTSIHFSVKVARYRSPADRQCDFVVTTQDRQKHIKRKPDISKDDPEFATFGCSVFLYECDTHSIRTQFPQNSFRVFSIDATGSWQMEEFAIIAQNRRAYLSRQLIYHGQAYRAEDGALCDPIFAKWTELQEMIRENESNYLYPKIKDFSPSETVLPSPTIEKGIVKFFGFATGWGSVLVMDRYGKKAEAMAHWKHIYIPTNTGRPLAYLARGEEVTCDLVPPAPTKETLFQYVAIGIRPCS